MTAINNFNQTSHRWIKNPLRIVNKFENFNECLFAKFSDGKSLVEKVLLNAIAQLGNSLNHTYLINESADFYDEFQYLQAELPSKTENIHQLVEQKSIVPYYSSEKLVFVITPTPLYTNYEKLFMPFDFITWILILFVFAIAFLVILIVNSTSKSIQILVYGKDIKVPSYNVVGTFFGAGQIKIPEANFPRIILMNFILFCLIIRTAYQGVQFDLLTNDIRRSLPKTIEELIERNFTFYSNSLRYVNYVNSIVEMKNLR
jgi:hypothetical protein